jgi:uncharacterized protein (UPF0261 family)
MTDKYIALISTMDTKARESAYMAELIQKRGRRVLTIDVGTMPHKEFSADVSNRALAAAGGGNLDVMADRDFPRDRCMEIMARGAGKILQQLFAEGKLEGVIGMGGNQGSSIAAAAMRGLPIGFPKYLVSTVASGNIRPYIGYTDIAVVFSVSDLVGGPNPVSRSILTNAVSAIIGMAEFGEGVKNSRPEKTIALTALGNTEASAHRIFNALTDRGYEVITFHASGAGGSAMEDLIEKGVFGGVIDLTPHELAEEVAGVGSYVPIKPGRLSAAGKRGIPQVVSMGGLEYYCGGSFSSLPEDHRKNRKVYMHNSLNANVKLSHEEMEKTGALMAERINQGKGQVRILIPIRGWSGYGSPGGPFYDPPANALLLKSLYKTLESGKAKIQEVDANINDDSFADACASAMLELGGKL